MINTDKYEGHTPAPWNADDDGAGGNLHVDAGDVRLPINWVDAQLMADAPLLLEKVLRLQRELDTQYEYIEWLEEFAPKAGDYNTVWDAYELAKGIHWTQVEEE